MKKALLLFTVLLGTTYVAFAQYYGNKDAPAFKMGVGITSGFAVGAVSGAFPEAGGLAIRAEFPVGKSPLSVVVSTGYTFYVSNNGYDVGYDYSSGFGFSTYSYGDIASFIPIEAGLKLYVGRRLFIEGDAGVSFNVNGNSSYYTGQSTEFIYSPAIGYSFPLGFSDRQKLDLSLLYENRPETGGGYSQVAARLVWNFSL